jgi:hypothetical protein
MKEQGIDEIADFRFGTDSSKLVTTTDKALSSMGKESWAKDSFSFRRGCYNQKGVICIISPRMIQMISIVFTGKLCKHNKDGNMRRGVWRKVSTRSKFGTCLRFAQ